MDIEEKIKTGYFNVPPPASCEQSDGSRVLKGSRQEWFDRQHKLWREFEQEAIEEVGLKGHPKARNAYSKAWDDRRSEGLQAVLDELWELAELML